MRAYLWDSILVYILGESMSHPFDFCERCEQHFFRISRSLPYSSLHPFLCDLFPCFDASWPSFTFLSFCFITPFRSTSSNFFIFSSFLMFDLGLALTLYYCLFDIFIHLSSLFVWGSLGLRLMMFSMHCISCMRGMRIISLGLLSLVSFRFFHLKILAYVMSRILRPPWGHDFTLCLTAHIWAW